MTLAFAVGPRTRKVLKIVGYVVLGIVTFVYALHLTFPYDRLKDRGIQALSSKYDVTVGKVERGWLPGDFSLINVILRTRPTKAGEIAKIIKIDRLDVDVGILPILSGRVEVAIAAKMGPGHIDGSVVVQKGRLQVSMASKNLSLSDVPGLAGVIGMPMGGRGNVTAKLDLPGNDWRKATARLTIECPGCTVGGEGAFFKPKNTNARTEGFVGQGVPVPLLAITNLSAQWTVAKGKITTDRFQFTSPHLTLELEFSATVEKELSKSKVDSACLRYRGTDELKKLSIKFYDALELTGGPLGPDDQRHLKLVGTLGGFRALPKVCGPGSDTDTGDDVAGGNGRTHSRPSLGNVPAEGGENGSAAGAGAVEPRVLDTVPQQPPPEGEPGQAKPNDIVGKPPELPPDQAQPPAGQTIDAAPEPPPQRLEEVPAQPPQDQPVEPPPPPPQFPNNGDGNDYNTQPPPQPPPENE